MLPHLFLAGVVLSGATQPLYRDATQPVNVRVSDLLSKMNIEEKVAQLLNPFSSGTMGLHCFDPTLPCLLVASHTARHGITACC